MQSKLVAIRNLAVYPGYNCILVWQVFLWCFIIYSTFYRWCKQQFVHFFFREALWKANDYVSSSIEIEEEEDEEEIAMINFDDNDNEDNDDETENKNLDLNYVIGDVTHPQSVGTKVNIITHCIGINSF